MSVLIPPASSPRPDATCGRAHVLRGLAVAAALGLAACPKPPAPPALLRPVVLVDGHPIAAMELRRELWRVHGRPEGPAPARLEVARAMLDQLIDQQLLLAAAVAAGMTASPRELQAAWEQAQEGYRSQDFKAALYAQMLTPELMRQRLADRLSVERYLRDKAKDLPRITDEQVKAEYEGARSQYHQPEQVRARQVLVRTQEEAELVAKRLKAGDDFEKVVREHSLAPERERGGDLGFFARGVMPEAFDQSCFSLEPGQVSDVVQSEYGFHLFQVVDRRPELNLPLAAVSDDIRERLRRRQLENHEARLLEALRKAAVIQRVDDLIQVVAESGRGTDGGSP